MKNWYSKLIKKLQKTSFKLRVAVGAVLAILIGVLLSAISISLSNNDNVSKTEKPATQQVSMTQVAGDTTTAPTTDQPKDETKPTTDSATQNKTQTNNTSTQNNQGGNNTPSNNTGGSNTPAPTPADPCAAITYGAPVTQSGITGINTITMPAGCTTTTLTLSYSGEATDWLPNCGGCQWSDGATEKPSPVVLLLGYPSTQTYNGTTITFRIKTLEGADPGYIETGFYVMAADAMFTIGVTVN